MPANTLSLNFTGANFKGSFPANQLKLNFVGSYIVTKKESSLNFWGSSAKDADRSKLNYQII